MDNLTTALRAVANQRAAVDTLSAKMAAMLKAVRDSNEYLTLELARAEAANGLSDTEERAKALAIDAFLADGKKTRPGVTVKTFTDRRVIYDHKAAYKWASEYAPNLIVLDTKLFEKHVLATAQTMPVPCAEIVESKEDRAQLASDLSEFATPAEIKVESEI